MINRYDLRLVAHAVLAVLLMTGLPSCGGNEQRINPAAFATGWLAAESEHIKVLAPPDSPRIEHLQAFADACEDAFGQLTSVLALNVTEKIEVYRFVTGQDCQQATGQPAGYVDKYRVFTRLGAPIGGAIALAACTSIDPEARSFDMIRDGLREAFDNQNTNIHREVSTLRADGRLRPLADLIAAASPGDRDAYTLQSASLVAYLIQRHGVEKFKMLWRSVLQLGPSLEKIYGGSLDQIEQDWIAHLEREAKKS